MKLALFGGTGRVGSEIVRLALDDEVEVKTLVRDEKRAMEVIPGAEFVIGDAKNEEDVKKTIANCDAVISALNTDKTDTLSKSVPLIIKAMEEEGITRIVTIGTAGILNSRNEDGKYRYQTNESKRKKTFAAEEHVKVYEALKESNLNWTIICPTYLPDGERYGNIRSERDLLPEEGKKITVEDTAFFAYQELHKNAFLYHRVGICY
ncbi:NAD(P)-dependent oxidoreductase [Halobacillus trueperi]|uniref:NAD-dependent epimerase/dehydratase family protein n=1 Tax=Halobacillus trueperi TaxID=156205 RepID=A0A3E0J2W0_9BACI|nr:SDR family oxidoreductase [Halobacillus trueperi]REJ07288.1 NAD-dependent epimerase/dehydratase family protein [Halobacillus trueperi]